MGRWPPLPNFHTHPGPFEDLPDPLEPCPALDQPLDPTLPDTHSVARLMAACQFTQLEAFLERHGREAINGGILASANHP